MEEQEAWSIIEDCASQIQVAGMGGVPIGIDYSACMRIATERGYNIRVMTYLMPSVENGMLKAFRDRMSTERQMTQRG